MKKKSPIEHLLKTPILDIGKELSRTAVVVITPKDGNNDMVTAKAFQEAIQSNSSPILLSHNFEVKFIEPSQQVKDMLEHIQHTEQAIMKAFGIPNELVNKHERLVFETNPQRNYLNFRMQQENANAMMLAWQNEIHNFGWNWNNEPEDVEEEWKEEYIEGENYKTKPL
jgi:hypothetical protein